MPSFGGVHGGINDLEHNYDQLKIKLQTTIPQQTIQPLNQCSGTGNTKLTNKPSQFSIKKQIETSVLKDAFNTKTTLKEKINDIDNVLRSLLQQSTIRTDYKKHSNNSVTVNIRQNFENNLTDEKKQELVETILYKTLEMKHSTKKTEEWRLLKLKTKNYHKIVSKNYLLLLLLLNQQNTFDISKRLLNILINHNSKSNRKKKHLSNLKKNQNQIKSNNKTNKVNETLNIIKLRSEKFKSYLNKIKIEEREKFKKEEQCKQNDLLEEIDDDDILIRKTSLDQNMKQETLIDIFKKLYPEQAEYNFTNLANELLELNDFVIANLEESKHNLKSVANYIQLYAKIKTAYSAQLTYNDFMKGITTLDSFNRNLRFLENEYEVHDTNFPLEELVMPEQEETEESMTELGEKVKLTKQHNLTIRIGKNEYKLKDNYVVELESDVNEDYQLLTKTQSTSVEKKSSYQPAQAIDEIMINNDLTDAIHATEFITHIDNALSAKVHAGSEIAMSHVASGIVVSIINDTKASNTFFNRPSFSDLYNIIVDGRFSKEKPIINNERKKSASFFLQNLKFALSRILKRDNMTYVLDYRPFVTLILGLAYAITINADMMYNFYDGENYKMIYDKVSKKNEKKDKTDYMYYTMNPAKIEALVKRANNVSFVESMDNDWSLMEFNEFMSVLTPISFIVLSLILTSKKKLGKLLSIVALVYHESKSEHVNSAHLVNTNRISINRIIHECNAYTRQLNIKKKPYVGMGFYTTALRNMEVDLHSKHSIVSLIFNNIVPTPCYFKICVAKTIAQSLDTDPYSFSVLDLYISSLALVTNSVPNFATAVHQKLSLLTVGPEIYKLKEDHYASLEKKKRSDTTEHISKQTTTEQQQIEVEAGPSTSQRKKQPISDNTFESLEPEENEKWLSEEEDNSSTSSSLSAVPDPIYKEQDRIDNIETEIFKTGTKKTAGELITLVEKRQSKFIDNEKDLLNYVDVVAQKEKKTDKPFKAHLHCCDKCGTLYVHNHIMMKPHKQYEFQCPNKDCEWYEANDTNRVNNTDSYLVALELSSKIRAGDINIVKNFELPLIITTAGQLTRNLSICRPAIHLIMPAGQLLTTLKNEYTDVVEPMKEFLTTEERWSFQTTINFIQTLASLFDVVEIAALAPHANHRAITILGLSTLLKTRKLGSKNNYCKNFAQALLSAIFVGSFKIKSSSGNMRSNALTSEKLHSNHCSKGKFLLVIQKELQECLKGDRSPINTKTVFFSVASKKPKCGCYNNLEITTLNKYEYDILSNLYSSSNIWPIELNAIGKRIKYYRKCSLDNKSATETGLRQQQSYMKAYGQITGKASFLTMTNITSLQTPMTVFFNDATTADNNDKNTDDGDNLNNNAQTTITNNEELGPSLLTIIRGLQTLIYSVIFVIFKVTKYLINLLTKAVYSLNLSDTQPNAQNASFINRDFIMNIFIPGFLWTFIFYLYIKMIIFLLTHYIITIGMGLIFYFLKRKIQAKFEKPTQTRPIPENGLALSLLIYASNNFINKIKIEFLLILGLTLLLFVWKFLLNALYYSNKKAGFTTSCLLGLCLLIRLNVLTLIIVIPVTAATIWKGYNILEFRKIKMVLNEVKSNLLAVIKEQLWCIIDAKTNQFIAILGLLIISVVKLPVGTLIILIIHCVNTGFIFKGLEAEVTQYYLMTNAIIFSSIVYNMSFINIMYIALNWLYLTEEDFKTKVLLFSVMFVLINKVILLVMPGVITQTIPLMMLEIEVADNDSYKNDYLTHTLNQNLSLSWTHDIILIIMYQFEMMKGSYSKFALIVLCVQIIAIALPIKISNLLQQRKKKMAFLELEVFLIYTLSKISYSLGIGWFIARVIYEIIFYTDVLSIQSIIWEMLFLISFIIKASRLTYALLALYLTYGLNRIDFLNNNDKKNVIKTATWFYSSLLFIISIVLGRINVIVAISLQLIYIYNVWSLQVNKKRYLLLQLCVATWWLIEIYNLKLNVIYGTYFVSSYLLQTAVLELTNASLWGLNTNLPVYVNYNMSHVLEFLYNVSLSLFTNFVSFIFNVILGLIHILTKLVRLTNNKYIQSSFLGSLIALLVVTIIKLQTIDITTINVIITIILLLTIIVNRNKEIFKDLLLVIRNSENNDPTQQNLNSFIIKISIVTIFLFILTKLGFYLIEKYQEIERINAARIEHDKLIEVINDMFSNKKIKIQLTDLNTLERQVKAIAASINMGVKYINDDVSSIITTLHLKVQDNVCILTLVQATCNYSLDNPWWYLYSQLPELQQQTNESNLSLYINRDLRGGMYFSRSISLHLIPYAQLQIIVQNEIEFSHHALITIVNTLINYKLDLKELRPKITRNSISVIHSFLYNDYHFNTAIVIGNSIMFNDISNCYALILLNGTCLYLLVNNVWVKLYVINDTSYLQALAKLQLVNQPSKIVILLMHPELKFNRTAIEQEFDTHTVSKMETRIISDDATSRYAGLYEKKRTTSMNIMLYNNLQDLFSIKSPTKCLIETDLDNNIHTELNVSQLSYGSKRNEAVINKRLEKEKPTKLNELHVALEQEVFNLRTRLMEESELAESSTARMSASQETLTQLGDEIIHKRGHRRASSTLMEDILTTLDSIKSEKRNLQNPSNQNLSLQFLAWTLSIVSVVGYILIVTYSYYYGTVSIIFKGNTITNVPKTAIKKTNITFKRSDDNYIMCDIDDETGKTVYGHIMSEFTPNINIQTVEEADNYYNEGNLKIEIIAKSFDYCAFTFAKNQLSMIDNISTSGFSQSLLPHYNVLSILLNENITSIRASVLVLERGVLFENDIVDSLYVIKQLWPNAVSNSFDIKTGILNTNKITVNLNEIGQFNQKSKKYNTVQCSGEYNKLTWRIKRNQIINFIQSYDVINDEVKRIYICNSYSQNNCINKLLNVKMHNLDKVLEEFNNNSLQVIGGVVMLGTSDIYKLLIGLVLKTYGSEVMTLKNLIQLLSDQGAMEKMLANLTEKGNHNIYLKKWNKYLSEKNKSSASNQDQEENLDLPTTSNIHLSALINQRAILAAFYVPLLNIIGLVSMSWSSILNNIKMYMYNQDDEKLKFSNIIPNAIEKANERFFPNCGLMYYVLLVVSEIIISGCVWAAIGLISHIKSWFLRPKQVEIIISDDQNIALTNIVIGFVCVNVINAIIFFVFLFNNDNRIVHQYNTYLIQNGLLNLDINKKFEHDLIYSRQNKIIASLIDSSISKKKISIDHVIFLVSSTDFTLQKWLEDLTYKSTEQLEAIRFKVYGLYFNLKNKGISKQKETELLNSVILASFSDLLQNYNIDIKKTAAALLFLNMLIFGKYVKIRTLVKMLDLLEVPKQQTPKAFLVENVRKIENMIVNDKETSRSTSTNNASQSHSASPSVQNTSFIKVSFLIWTVIAVINLCQLILMAYQSNNENIKMMLLFEEEHENYTRLLVKRVVTHYTNEITNGIEFLNDNVELLTLQVDDIGKQLQNVEGCALNQLESIDLMFNKKKIQSIDLLHDVLEMVNITLAGTGQNLMPNKIERQIFLIYDYCIGKFNNAHISAIKTLELVVACCDFNMQKVKLLTAPIEDRQSGSTTPTDQNYNLGSIIFFSFRFMLSSIWRSKMLLELSSKYSLNAKNEFNRTIKGELNSKQYNNKAKLLDKGISAHLISDDPKKKLLSYMTVIIGYNFKKQINRTWKKLHNLDHAVYDRIKHSNSKISVVMQFLLFVIIVVTGLNNYCTRVRKWTSGKIKIIYFTTIYVLMFIKINNSIAVSLLFAIILLIDIYQSLFYLKNQKTFCTCLDPNVKCVIAITDINKFAFKAQRNVSTNVDIRNGKVSFDVGPLTLPFGRHVATQDIIDFKEMIKQKKLLNQQLIVSYPKLLTVEGQSGTIITGLKNYMWKANINGHVFNESDLSAAKMINHVDLLSTGIITKEINSEVNKQLSQQATEYNNIQKTQNFSLRTHLVITIVNDQLLTWGYLVSETKDYTSVFISAESTSGFSGAFCYEIVLFKKKKNFTENDLNHMLTAQGPQFALRPIGVLTHGESIIADWDSVSVERFYGVHAICKKNDNVNLFYDINKFQNQEELFKSIEKSMKFFKNDREIYSIESSEIEEKKNQGSQGSTSKQNISLANITAVLKSLWIIYVMPVQLTIKKNFETIKCRLLFILTNAQYKGMCFNTGLADLIYNSEHEVINSSQSIIANFGILLATFNWHTSPSNEKKTVAIDVSEVIKISASIIQVHITSYYNLTHDKSQFTVEPLIFENKITDLLMAFNKISNKTYHTEVKFLIRKYYDTITIKGFELLKSIINEEFDENGDTYVNLLINHKSIDMYDLFVNNLETRIYNMVHNINHDKIVKQVAKQPKALHYSLQYVNSIIKRKIFISIVINKQDYLISGSFLNKTMKNMRTLMTLPAKYTIKAIDRTNRLFNSDQLNITTTVISMSRHEIGKLQKSCKLLIMNVKELIFKTKKKVKVTVESSSDYDSDDEDHTVVEIKASSKHTKAKLRTELNNVDVITNQRYIASDINEAFYTDVDNQRIEIGQIKKDDKGKGKERQKEKEDINQNYLLDEASTNDEIELSELDSEDEYDTFNVDLNEQQIDDENDPSNQNLLAVQIISFCLLIHLAGHITNGINGIYFLFTSLSMFCYTLNIKLLNNLFDKIVILGLLIIVMAQVGLIPFNAIMLAELINHKIVKSMVVIGVKILPIIMQSEYADIMKQNLLITTFKPENFKGLLFNFLLIFNAAILSINKSNANVIITTFMLWALLNLLSYRVSNIRSKWNKIIIKLLDSLLLYIYLQSMKERVIFSLFSKVSNILCKFIPVSEILAILNKNNKTQSSTHQNTSVINPIFSLWIGTLGIIKGLIGMQGMLRNNVEKWVFLYNSSNLTGTKLARVLETFGITSLSEQNITLVGTIPFFIVTIVSTCYIFINVLKDYYNNKNKKNLYEISLRLRADIHNAVRNMNFFSRSNKMNIYTVGAGLITICALSISFVKGILIFLTFAVGTVAINEEYSFYFLIPLVIGFKNLKISALILLMVISIDVISRLEIIKQTQAASILLPLTAISNVDNLVGLITALIGFRIGPKWHIDKIVDNVTWLAYSALSGTPQLAFLITSLILLDEKVISSGGFILSMVYLIFMVLIMWIRRLTEDYNKNMVPGHIVNISHTIIFAFSCYKSIILFSAYNWPLKALVIVHIFTICSRKLYMAIDLNGILEIFIFCGYHAALLKVIEQVLFLMYESRQEIKDIINKKTFKSKPMGQGEAESNYDEVYLPTEANTNVDDLFNALKELTISIMFNENVDINDEITIQSILPKPIKEFRDYVEKLQTYATLEQSIVDNFSNIKSITTWVETFIVTLIAASSSRVAIVMILICAYILLIQIAITHLLKELENKMTEEEEIRTNLKKTIINNVISQLIVSQKLTSLLKFFYAKHNAKEALMANFIGSSILICVLSILFPLSILKLLIIIALVFDLSSKNKILANNVIRLQKQIAYIIANENATYVEFVKKYETFTERVGDFEKKIVNLVEELTGDSILIGTADNTFIDKTQSMKMILEYLDLVNRGSKPSDYLDNLFGLAVFDQSGRSVNYLNKLNKLIKNNNLEINEKAKSMINANKYYNTDQTLTVRTNQYIGSVDKRTIGKEDAHDDHEHKQQINQFLMQRLHLTEFQCGVYLPYHKERMYRSIRCRLTYTSGTIDKYINFLANKKKKEHLINVIKNVGFYYSNVLKIQNKSLNNHGLALSIFNVSNKSSSGYVSNYIFKSRSIKLILVALYNMEPHNFKDNLLKLHELFKMFQNINIKHEVVKFKRFQAEQTLTELFSRTSELNKDLNTRIRLIIYAESISRHVNRINATYFNEQLRLLRHKLCIKIGLKTNVEVNYSINFSLRYVASIDVTNFDGHQHIGYNLIDLYLRLACTKDQESASDTIEHNIRQCLKLHLTPEGDFFLTSGTQTTGDMNTSSGNSNRMQVATISSATVMAATYNYINTVVSIGCQGDNAYIESNRRNIAVEVSTNLSDMGQPATDEGYADRYQIQSPLLTGYLGSDIVICKIKTKDENVYYRPICVRTPSRFLPKIVSNINIGTQAEDQVTVTKLMSLLLTYPCDPLLIKIFSIMKEKNYKPIKRYNMMKYLKTKIQEKPQGESKYNIGDIDLSWDQLVKKKTNLFTSSTIEEVEIIGMDIYEHESWIKELNVSNIIKRKTMVAFIDPETEEKIITIYLCPTNFNQTCQNCKKLRKKTGKICKVNNFQFIIQQNDNYRYLKNNADIAFGCKAFENQFNTIQGARSLVLIKNLQTMNCKEVLELINNKRQKSILDCMYDLTINKLGLEQGISFSEVTELIEVVKKLNTEKKALFEDKYCKARLDEIDQILNESNIRTRKLALIGLPGSGKSINAKNIPGLCDVDVVLNNVKITDDFGSDMKKEKILQKIEENKQSIIKQIGDDVLLCQNIEIATILQRTPVLIYCYNDEIYKKGTKDRNVTRQRYNNTLRNHELNQENVKILNSFIQMGKLLTITKIVNKSGLTVPQMEKLLHEI